jgi:hypothetical protein
LYWLRKSDAISLAGVTDAFAPPLLVAAAAFGVCRAAGFWSGVYPTGLGQAFGYGALFGLMYVVALRLIYHRQLEELVRYLPSGRRISRILRFQATA